MISLWDSPYQSLPVDSSNLFCRVALFTGPAAPILHLLTSRLRDPTHVQDVSEIEGAVGLMLRRFACNAARHRTTPVQPRLDVPSRCLDKAQGCPGHHLRGLPEERHVCNALIRRLYNECNGEGLCESTCHRSSWRKTCAQEQRGLKPPLPGTQVFRKVHCQNQGRKFT